MKTCSNSRTVVIVFEVSALDGSTSRDAILSAAANALAAAPDARMGQIAAAAGVSRATLYRHFPNRDRLVDALYAVAIDETAARLAAAGLDSVDVDEAIARITRALVSVGQRYVIMLRRRARIDVALRQKVIRPIAAVIERGQTEGEIRADLPVALLADSLLRLVGSTIRVEGELGDEDKAAEAALLFLEGAAARRPR